VEEAVEWLSYTYLYIRMLVNPMVYGIPYGAKEVGFIYIYVEEQIYTVFI
jgi:replicative superfamily II helicase